MSYTNLPTGTPTITGDFLLRGSRTQIRTEVTNGFIFTDKVHFKGDVMISGLDGKDDLCLKTIIINQQREIQELKKIVEEIYYAPGMPGYLRGEQSFEENKKRKIC